jgi:TrmH family RNA methyltransferase
VTITSSHNEKLKEIRKLTRQRRARDRAGRFVAEGEDLLAAADAAGWVAEERLCVAGSGLSGLEVDPELLAGASTLGSGTRTLAVYAERWAPAATGPVCVYLHGVADPGNVGTILRSVQAFGASSVALGPGTADPYGPKAVRASMGALFAVPLSRVTAPGQLPRPTVALVADTDTDTDPAHRPLRELELDAATLLVGAEREGLPAEVVAGADHVAWIPIATHSLNAAMAATVALYEVTRMAAG